MVRRIVYDKNEGKHLGKMLLERSTCNGMGRSAAAGSRTVS